MLFEEDANYARKKRNLQRERERERESFTTECE